MNQPEIYEGALENPESPLQQKCVMLCYPKWGRVEWSRERGDNCYINHMENICRLCNERISIFGLVVDRLNTETDNEHLLPQHSLHLCWTKQYYVCYIFLIISAI